jgi:hypothetical protein
VRWVVVHGERPCGWLARRCTFERARLRRRGGRLIGRYGLKRRRGLRLVVPRQFFLRRLLDVIVRLGVVKRFLEWLDVELFFLVVDERVFERNWLVLERWRRIVKRDLLGDQQQLLVGWVLLRERQQLFVGRVVIERHRRRRLRDGCDAVLRIAARGLRQRTVGQHGLSVYGRLRRGRVHELPARTHDLCELDAK